MNKLMLGLLLLVPGLGCVHIQPVGPFAEDFAGPASASPTAGAPMTAPKPIVRPTPPPPPPALLVTPGEVTEANCAEAARRLMEELEADRRSLEAMPLPAEVSVIKR